jgi:hypothetical protein
LIRGATLFETGDELSPGKNSQEDGTDQSKQGWRGKRAKKVLEAPRKKMKICCCIE